MSFVPSDGKANTCPGCSKRVYPQERLQACGASWHKGCLKCSQCKITLNLKTLNSYQNKPYCRTHKPDPSHTQVTDSVATKNAAAAPKTRMVHGVQKNVRATFAPGRAGPIRGVRGGGPARGGRGGAPGRGGSGGPGGPGPARGGGPGPARASAAAATTSAPRGISSARGGAPKFGAGGNKCPQCSKTVYPTEEVKACGSSWHKGCLKCTQCKITLNLKTLQSFGSKPYCRAHRPDPKATQVADRHDYKQAKKAPKATRMAQGVKRDQRMTFAPGANKPIITGDIVNPGGKAEGNIQQQHAPAQEFKAPEPAPHLTYENTGPSAGYTPETAYDDQSYGDQGGYDQGGYADQGAYDQGADAGYDQGYDQGADAGYDQGGYDQGADAGYDQGGYDQGADAGYDQGGYDQGADAGYDQGGYDQGAYDDQGGYDQGAYDDQGGYDQGAYDDQGGYDQGAYDQGAYDDQGGYDQGAYDQGAYDDQGGYDQGGYDQGGYDQGGYDDQAYYDDGQGGYGEEGQGGYGDDWQ